ncbi:hypothetical protein Prudu_1152S000100 [Prunus dulcis]|uniref:Reverse transcriptase Ty1/copia-type domain-containing protein n=1 Tax=Prunus dulcis TaxID=3755 RepID=A0A5H2XNY4_PRUDU|nr:hypothetical protein Prudu_1152S000100 [Prunus dulcis]
MRWFVTFIDDCTHMTWVYLLIHKSDVTSTIREFHAMITTQFQASIKVFQSDNGGEYLNNVLAQFFRDHDIIIGLPPLSLHNKMVSRNERIDNCLRLPVPSGLINQSLTIYGTPLNTLAPYISLPIVLKIPHRMFGCVVYAHAFLSEEIQMLPPPTQKLLIIIDVTFHEHLSYFVAHTSPSLQGEKGSEEENFCFEEDKDELRQLIDQHVPVDWSSSNREEPDEDLVLELTHDVSEVTNDVFEEQLQNTTPPALPSSQSSCDEEALENSTWEMVSLPKGNKPVGCRWIFTVKYKVGGSIDRYKARLEKFVPVAKINTIHVNVLFYLAANLDWPLLRYDVKNAFLHGDLQEEVYIDPPPGIPMTSTSNTVCKLRKSLYGLK